MVAIKNEFLPDELPEFDGGTFDLLAFGPHPDDVEHAMGASIIRWTDAGKRVLICHLTNGETGTFGSADLRRAEAAAAAEKLKASHLHLRFPDANIRDTQAARHALIAVVRAYRPQIVFAPYYHFPTMHPDHEATGQIARAVYRMARFSGIDTGQEPHWVKYLFHYILPPEVKPSFIVDVSDLHDRWLEAARCYESQLDNIPNYYNRLIALKKVHTVIHQTADLVEAFYSDRPLDLTDVDLLGLR